MRNAYNTHGSGYLANSKYTVRASSGFPGWPEQTVGSSGGIRLCI